MQVSSLGGEDPVEEDMATYSSILAWRISWTEEPGDLPSIGSQRVWQDWSDLALMHMLAKIFMLLCSQILGYFTMFFLNHNQVPALKDEP